IQGAGESRGGPERAGGEEAEVDAWVSGLRPAVLERADRHVLAGMIVLDAVGDPEAGRRAEIATLEDDSFRKDHAGIRFGPGNRIAYRAALDLHILTAFDA